MEPTCDGSVQYFAKMSQFNNVKKNKQEGKLAFQHYFSFLKLKKYIYLICILIIYIYEKNNIGWKY